MKKELTIFDRYGNAKDMEMLRRMIAYDELPAWRKFLHGWSVTGYSIKYPFIYYKLWKMTKK